MATATIATQINDEEGVNRFDPASPEMQPGFRGRLDATMEKKLAELRELVDTKTISSTFVEGLGGITTDDVLLRFLRASQWDVAQAQKRVEQTVKWRLEFQGTGVNAVTRATIENELATGKSFFCGADKFGHPLAYIRVRLHDKKKSDPEEMRRFVVWCFEAGRSVIKAPVQQCGLIFDMEGFGLANTDYDFVQFLIATFRDYYPESLGIGLIVGAPFIFKSAWAIIKRWMDPVTVSKIHFISKKELTNYIHPAQLHVDYGGQRQTDPWPADPPLPGTPEALALAESVQAEGAAAKDPSSAPAPEAAPAATPVTAEPAAESAANETAAPEVAAPEDAKADAAEEATATA